MKLVKDILIENPFHIIIVSYLNLNDNKNILLLNKLLFNNKINKLYYKKIININSRKIIFNFMKRYLDYINYINNIENLILLNLLTKRINASYFFKNYDKKYVNSWYNINISWKKNIIDLYKTKYTNNPSRIDLFNLIKKIPIDETFLIGW